MTSDDKDEATAELRALLRAAHDLREVAERAEAGLTTLAFAGVAHPQRNVWIDTDLAGRIAIDLEDFAVAGEWDNAVARVAADDAAAAVATVRAWLGGADVDAAIAAAHGHVQRR